MPNKLTYEFIKERIESFNHTLLSTEYVNAKTKLSLKCDKGHVCEIKWDYFRKSGRCPVCHGKQKITYEFVKKYIESFGYTLLSTEYKNAKTKLLVECDRGHEYEVK
jgi:hypothetical protein